MFREVYTKGKTLDKIQPRFPWITYVTMPIILRRLKDNAWGQGVGRHSQEVVYELGLKDFRALSGYLGTKTFFTGEKATELDCVAFGLLAQWLWNCPGNPYEHLFDGIFCLNRKFYKVLI